MTLRSSMYNFKLFFLLAIFVSCQNSSSFKKLAVKDVEEYRELHPFLKEGVYKVEYYASKEVTSEHKRILKKLTNRIETNEKARNYFVKIKEGGTPEYNSAIGISRQEFNQLINLFSYEESKKRNGALTISREGDYLCFKGDGRLSLFDSVRLNISGMSASFKQYNMGRIKDSIDLPNEEIHNGDTLDHIEFYKGPDGILGLVGLDGKYELLLGKLRPSGRIYLSIFSRQPDSIEHPIPEYITIIFD